MATFTAGGDWVDYGQVDGWSHGMIELGWVLYMMDRVTAGWSKTGFKMASRRDGARLGLRWRHGGMEQDWV